MLQLKLSLDNIEDAAGKRIVLNDATGDYDATSNTTGYGTPNQTRNQIAIYPIVYLISSKGDKSLVTLDPFNPLTAITWNAVTKGDGWYSSQLVYASVDTNPLISNYQEGDVLFSVPDFKLLRVDTGSSGLVFTAISPDYLLSINSSVVVDQLFIANTSFTKIALNRAKIELLINSENLSNSTQLRVVQNAYDQVRSLIQGAIYEFCIGNKYEAARFIEFLSTNNYTQLSPLININV